MTLMQLTLVLIVGDESVARPLHSKSGPSSVATIHRRSDMPLPHRLAKSSPQTRGQRHTGLVAHRTRHKLTQLHQPISVRRRTFLSIPAVHELQKVKGCILLYVAFHVMAGRPVAARLTWLSGFTKTSVDARSLAFTSPQNPAEPLDQQLKQ